jgi:hypothetical protein
MVNVDLIWWRGKEMPEKKDYSFGIARMERYAGKDCSDMKKKEDLNKKEYWIVRLGCIIPSQLRVAKLLSTQLDEQMWYYKCSVRLVYQELEDNKQKEKVRALFLS